jgi:Outer membrane protein beta-barrel domain
MSLRTRASGSLVLLVLCLSLASTVEAQPADEYRFMLDFGAGIDLNVNGNINSGGIGQIENQATAILPNPYGSVYGTGLHFRFGVGYWLNDESELRGVFTYQSADADLVRLGDIGPSSLYGQYSDYKTLGLDLGYRRYLPDSYSKGLRIYGEATVGAAFIDEITVLLAAPQSNLVFNQTDFYDRTAAFTWGVNFGALFPVSSKLDVNAQIGLRHVSGLAEPDQFIGTGLDDINNDSGRLTFPVVLGLRVRF